jgi:hypothetical protein
MFWWSVICWSYDWNKIENGPTIKTKTTPSRQAHITHGTRPKPRQTITNLWDIAQGPRTKVTSQSWWWRGHHLVDQRCGSTKPPYVEGVPCFGTKDFLHIYKSIIDDSCQSCPGMCLIHYVKGTFHPIHRTPIQKRSRSQPLELLSIVGYGVCEREMLILSDLSASLHLYLNEYTSSWSEY